MDDAFVPDYRVLDGILVRDNTYSDRWRPDAPLYAMRFGVMFPFAISAGTFGIARGAMRAAWDHIEARVSSQGSVSKADPFVLAALARAESDVEASISHVQSIIARLLRHRLRRRRHHGQGPAPLPGRPGAGDGPGDRGGRRALPPDGLVLHPEGLAARALLARPPGRLDPRLQQPRALLRGLGSGRLRRRDPTVRPVLKSSGLPTAAQAWTDVWRVPLSRSSDTWMLLVHLVAVSAASGVEAANGVLAG